eukprot:TRINITY_DN232_c0_g1_i1.p1 TRINITY_DN232_c0_g1~~TRINITY_DN232_c0_g1_i1.p1  ORF type:complete len:367 (-),score=138.06 TRINITY_DN232_c0_g1_i1:137-1237(-)
MLLPAIIAGAIFTGSLNTLAAKWADRTDARGIDGVARPFVHPFFQAIFMFLGESLCFVAYHIMLRRNAGKPASSDEPQNDPLAGEIDSRPQAPASLFLIPALCDYIATSVMFFGLNLTYASVFQMLRGGVIVFTGLLSVMWLKRQMAWSKWAGIGFIMVGLAVVGISSALNASGKASSNMMLGNLLVLVSQIIVAFQMVLEERLLMNYQVAPLLAVGYEGLFGLFFSLTLLLPLYYIPGWDVGGVLENTPQALAQMGNSGVLTASLIVTVFSIAFFNAFGLTITKMASATTRTIVDSVRVLFVWAICLALGWEHFHFLQVIGFAVLLLGTFTYNGVIRYPCFVYEEPASEQEKSTLLSNNQANTSV